MDKFNKCVWFARTIMNAGETGITLREISEKWERSFAQDGEKELKRRTFENYKNYIRDMFDLDIQIHKSQNRYFFSQEDIHLGDGLKMWLLDSFSIQSKLSGNIDLKGRIQFEKNPGGSQFMEPIITAMENYTAIVVHYKKFSDAIVSEKTVFPYALKQFKQRWYVIVGNEAGYIYPLALDRIVTVDQTNLKFSLPKDFNIDEYYSNCYGIIRLDECEPQVVTIRIDSDQAKYVKTLPLHESQTILKEDEYSTTFSWYLRPTFDFRMEILSYGNSAVVLEPKSFHDEMKKTLKNALAMYNEK